MSISWKEALVVGLVPFGQLWVRGGETLKGSLDKPYLMFPLLMMPPFSIIIALLMKFFDIIAPSPTGKTTSYDWYMLAPIITKFILIIGASFLYKLFENHETVLKILLIFLPLLSMMVPIIYRRKVNCDDITGESIGKIIMDSFILLGLTNLFAAVVSWGLTVVPILGQVLMVIEAIPIIGEVVNLLFWVMGFFPAYMLMNMINQKNLDTFCNRSFFGDKTDKIAFIIAIFAFILTFVSDTVGDLMNPLTYIEKGKDMVSDFMEDDEDEDEE